MASVENPSNDNNANNKGELPSLSALVPAVFHPPYPSMRNGPHDSSDQSSQGSRSHRSYRHNDPSMAANSYQKDKMMQRDQRAGQYETYYVQNDGREYETYQPVEGREGSSRNDDRRADNGHHYNSYSRDGPSPGRGYTQNYPRVASEQMRSEQMRSEQMRHPPAHRFHRPVDRMPYQPMQQPGSPPFRNAPATNGKRKADPSTPEGPRLISNQSSDDSINALLPPPKRTRSSTNFSESVALVKSFTPLSPIHSRTFSRDEAIDMPRFMDSRGSAEGLRIFQSWSSGNTPPQGDQSSLDVRYCYNDWHGPGRRSSVKMSSIKEGKVERKPSSGSGSRTPPNKTSRGQAPPQERYSPPREHSFNRGGGHGDQFAPPNNFNNRTHANSQYTQPLHPEDRFGPFNDQLSSRMPKYNQEVQPRYWQEGGAPYQQYPPSRRRDPEDSHSPARRGTPPASNGWNNRYEEYPPNNSSMYEHQAMRSRPPQYETWSDNRPYPDASYGNRPVIEQHSREYTGRHLQSAIVESGPDGAATSMRTATGILLLSLPEDKISLSETLCVVRENIEVFIATEADVKAPAPGRKRPVVVGQVGLRCIHCRVATHQSEKVKRAVCFPSSIKRIYRTVIDMKLDHFKACRFVPPEFKMKLEQLKATNARSTGTTMQYFVQASNRMGMVDGGHGIRFCRETNDSAAASVTPGDMPAITGNSRSAPIKEENLAHPKPTADGRHRTLDRMPSHMSFSLSMDLSLSGASSSSAGKMGTSDSASIRDGIPTFDGITALSCPEDKSALSPLRCFLRENVYAFSATAEDIAVRTPTTFSVVKGQVGIGCVHCYHLPAKERSNRAVCFPFSIGRIYQSVADIQRFHIYECKMIPHDVKQKFLELQRASSKGSKGLATRQYWITSAKKRGLVDTSNGIRFARDPSVPLEKAVSLDILAQVAIDVTAASKPLVLPEDKDEIAEFIFVVMNQLQPCRFTEADRNKRRLKDVGCKGVECQHCAGKVDGRKFFWSSVNAVESNFVSVHTHMMECKYIPDDLKEELAQLKTLRKEHTAKLKTGSQKAFFARVWRRLHAEVRNNSNTAGETSSAYSVPPHVAVTSQLHKTPSSPQGTQRLAFNLSNVSSPTGSFAEHMNTSPITPGKPKIEAERVFHGHSSQSGEKFPMLPLTLTSPPPGSRNSPQVAEQYPMHESV